MTIAKRLLLGLVVVTVAICAGYSVQAKEIEGVEVAQAAEQEKSQDLNEMLSRVKHRLSSATPSDTTEVDRETATLDKLKDLRSETERLEERVKQLGDNPDPEEVKRIKEALVKIDSALDAF